MDTADNAPEDFPSASFTLLAFCAACEHFAALNRESIPCGVKVQALPSRLRCSACGSRGGSIRIVYTGAGGFQYGFPGAGLKM